MAERYHRSQILLWPEQHERMRRIAEREGRSISDVARELIGVGLDALASDEGARARRRAQALERLNRIRETAQARYGIYDGDLVAQGRSEREQGLEPVQRDAE